MKPNTAMKLIAFVALLRLELRPFLSRFWFLYVVLSLFLLQLLLLTPVEGLVSLSLLGFFSRTMVLLIPAVLISMTLVFRWKAKPANEKAKESYWVPLEFLVTRPVSRGSIFTTRAFLQYGFALGACLPVLLWVFFGPILPFDSDLPAPKHLAASPDAVFVAHLPGTKLWIGLFLATYALMAVALSQVVDAMGTTSRSRFWRWVVNGSGLSLRQAFEIAIYVVPYILFFPGHDVGWQAVRLFVSHAGMIIPGLIVVLYLANTIGCRQFCRRDVE